MENEIKEEKKQNKTLDFFVRTLNGMAIGLFATLIIGTIFQTIGKLFGFGAGNGFCDFMRKIIGDGKEYTGFSGILQMLTGAGIGVGIAFSQKYSPLKTVTLAIVGMAAAYFSLSTKFITAYSPEMHYGSLGVGKVGDPLTIYIVCVSVSLLMDLILTKKTSVDFILIPLLGTALGILASLGARYPAIYVTYGIQWIINAGTNTVPFIMGIIVAVVMGMALTAPISSAAIAAMLFTGISISNPDQAGLVIASGAAIVGCSTQMIGFMVQSRKDNNVGTLISIGIGTSMLQFKNILKKPIIWLPTIIVSAILGPVSTCWLKLYCVGADAGMGTAGLVGQIGTLSSMGADKWQAWVGVIGLQILLPAILVFLVDLLFRKLGWIKEGDLKI